MPPGELGPFVERFFDRGRAQLLVRRVEGSGSRYNEVRLDDSSRVVSFREKPEHNESGQASIAVYLLPAQLPVLVTEYLAAGGVRDAPGHLLEWLVERIPVEGSPIEGAWFDVGDREDLEAARRALAHESG